MLRSKLYFTAALAAIGVAVYGGLRPAPALTVAGGVASLCALILFYRATSKPMRAIRSGMDLLRSQDFASRLRSVGQKDADEVVNLFNKIMDSMKSERLKNEEQNAFLGKLIEASPMGVAMCRLDGTIEESNPSFKKLDSEVLRQTLALLGDGEQITVRPGGGQVLRCSRMYFMDRGFRRPFFLVERLTDEIVRAETDLFQKIVRTMGHEVNNTLGGVVSVLETLEDVHRDDADVTEVLGSCRGSCLALGEFVRSYSAVVKLPEPVLERVDPGSFTAGAANFLSRLCPPHIRLTTEVADSAPISADTTLLERVLVNAVKNAVESIGDREGRIILRNTGRVIEIIDNGSGISPENAARIFTPFFSTKRPDRGLGLMLIADILRKHKADFALTTTDDGLTHLTIEFPRPA